METTITGADLKSGAARAVESIISRHGESRIKVTSLEVTFTGSGAFTTYTFHDRAGVRELQGLINLPWVEDDARVSRADADKISAYWIHEALHIFYTDFEAFKRVSGSRPDLKNIINAMEDVRIEARCIGRAAVPGFSPLCVRLVNSLVHESLVKEDLKQPWDTNNLNDEAWSLAVFGRAHVGGLTFDKVGDLWSRTAPALVTKWSAVLAELKLAANVADVIQIALKYWPSPVPPPQPPQPPKGKPEPQDGDEGQPGQPKPEPEPEDTDEGDKPEGGDAGDGKGEDDSDESGEGESGEGDEGDPADSGDGDGKPGDGEGDGKPGDGDGDGDGEGESGEGESEGPSPGGGVSRTPEPYTAGPARGPELKINDAIDRANGTTNETPESLRRQPRVTVVKARKFMNL